jgi:glucosamine-6-phosphate deaminase
MNINIATDSKGLGKNAAYFVASKLKEVIQSKEEARLLVSTGSSQFETLSALLECDIDWTKVEVFHLDEYIGLPDSHPASFRKYLHERFIDKIPVKKFFPVNGNGRVKEHIKALSVEINARPIDIGLIGIGENAHIAFNDPPADFDTKEPYVVVDLEERCKLQQVNEGWFSSLEEVPAKAISMSVWQIMQCKLIVSAVPHSVKADAVYNTLSQELNNRVPSTMLKQHPDWHLYLDMNSASSILWI